MRTAKIEKHYDVSELEKVMKDFRNNVQVYERLLFIRMLLKGKTITEASDLLNIRRETGSRWLKEYNLNKLNGLIPDYSNVGSKARLTEEQFKEFKTVLYFRSYSVFISSFDKYARIPLHEKLEICEIK